MLGLGHGSSILSETIQRPVVDAESASELSPEELSLPPTWTAET